MTFQGWHSLRRNRGTDGSFAMHVGRVTPETVGGADHQERAVIRAPTALEVVQRDRSRDPSP